MGTGQMEVVNRRAGHIAGQKCVARQVGPGQRCSAPHGIKSRSAAGCRLGCCKGGSAGASGEGSGLGGGHRLAQRAAGHRSSHGLRNSNTKPGGGQSSGQGIGRSLFKGREGVVGGQS